MTELQQVAKLLLGARRVLFITGAGISADSGLPTYRGIGGLYNDADTEEGIPIEEALSGRMLRARPEVCWRHIARIEAACRGARPNAAHAVIAQLEQAGLEVWVLTQNVDGLHRAAGSTRVIAIHGDVHTLYCTRCAWREEVVDFAHITALPPSCPQCSGLIRPDVVLFEEWLGEANLRTLRAQLQVGFDLVFSIGTSSLFPYIMQPVVEAVREGVPTVEINPTETTISSVVLLRVRMGAAKALEGVWTEYQELLG